MNKSAVSAAISTVRQLMKEWFEIASEREHGGWVEILRMSTEDISSPWDHIPEPYCSNPPDEAVIAFDVHLGQFEKQQRELQEKERQFQKISKPAPGAPEDASVD